jgi:hypothetical protein
MNWEHYLGIKLSVLIAGLAGAIASLTFERKLTFLKALFLISTGAVTAGYLHPVFSHYLGAPDSFSSAIGFILGLVSMRLLEFILDRFIPYLSSFIKLNNVVRSKSDSDDN